MVLISVACSWLFVYVDSVYQRRRAESLFADLKSLDFATAGFPEVRDIIVRNGGHVGSTCTPQNCMFQLWIMTPLPWIITRGPRIPLLDKNAEFFYTTLPYIGVRSWALGAIFEVRNGKLERSSTAVSELRMERLDSGGHRYMVPLAYNVETRRDAASFQYGPCSNRNYAVNVSHGGFKFPAYMLDTCVLQSTGMPVKRAFDVHLRCLNNPFRDCRFGELAPSAWADYSAKGSGTDARDPYK